MLSSLDAGDAVSVPVSQLCHKVSCDQQIRIFISYFCSDRMEYNPSNFQSLQVVDRYHGSDPQLEVTENLYFLFL